MISADALTAYAEELEEAATGAGLEWLKARRDESLARINGGGSREYIETTVNGQQFRGQITATAVDWFETLQLAIKQLTGTACKVVYARSPTPSH